MTATQERTHALVVGGSLTGLMATAALARHVPSVTLLARDGRSVPPRNLAGFLATMPGIILEVVHLAAAGPLLMAKRFDRFVMPNGHRFDLPVTGVFEVRDGKIVAFRDYFNLATFETERGLQLEGCEPAPRGASESPLAVERYQAYKARAVLR